MKYLSGSRLWLLCVVLLGAAGRVAGQAPGWAWATSPGKGCGYSTITDASGNVYVTGVFNDTATFGTTTLISEGRSNDIFVAKLTTGGVYQWAVRAGGSNSEAGSSITVDGSGNVIITGAFLSPRASFGATTLVNTSSSSQDVFVAKLTPNGAWLWAVGVGGVDADGGGRVTIDSNDNVIITGGFNSPTISFGSTTLINAVRGSADVFVAKLTPSGVWQWATSAGGSTNDYSTGLAVASNDDIAIGGSYDSPSAIFGSTTLTGRGNIDVFVAKLTSAGVWQWATSGGGSGADQCGGVALDGSGNVVVTGGINSSTATFGTIPFLRSGFFVAALTPAGIWQWAIGPTGTDNAIGSGVAINASGNVVITGSFNTPTVTFGSTTLTNAGIINFFVAQLTPSGAWQWAISTGGRHADYSYGLTVDRSGNVYVTGYCDSDTVAFGSTLLTTPTSLMRSFIARLFSIPQAVSTSLSSFPFTLFPNPAHTTVALSGLAPTKSTATLFDGLGRVVRVVALTQGAATLDVRGLAAGLYVVRCGGAVRRLVVD